MPRVRCFFITALSTPFTTAPIAFALVEEGIRATRSWVATDSITQPSPASMYKKVGGESDRGAAGLLSR